MQTTICPPSDQLRDYLSGKLDFDSSNDLAQHLQDCADCERTATELEAEPDTLVELLQSDLPPHSKSASDSKSGQPDPDEDVSWNSSVNGRVPAVMPSELGQYELLSRLGAGGMGAVYLARHKSLDKQVALKLLPALPAQNAEFVARFQREMRAAGKLDHPAIVRTTDAGEQQGIHFLVMDAIDGMNLSGIARAEEKLAIPDACEVIRQSAIGLAHAHEKGIVHRDVKPSNLMLDNNGNVCILDFGLAQIGFWDAGSAEITTVGQLMGTLDYMAPEQAERGGAVDYRADLYSLGSTLFRLLTGRAPLAAAPNLTPLEKLRLLATHKPPKLRSLRGDVPDELGEIVDAMLASDPASRPASATHVAELLDPFSSGSDLVGLLNRARSKPVIDDDSFVVSPLLQRDLTGDKRPDSAVSDKSPTRSLLTARKDSDSRPRGILWLALAGCLALLCAGIVFVLELGKGQLVIDSQADVHVKIVSVDGEGKRSEVDELQIVPGTKTTRLKSGKYEIALDAASDSFGVTNQTFTIRNGQTVVATITSQPNANAGADVADESAVAKRDPQTDDPQTEDPRLNEVVYDGESLDTWLRRLKFERNPDEVSRAMTAIGELADEDLRDMIQQPLFEFILSREAAHRGFYGPALAALSKSSGSDFFEVVASLLSQMESEDEKIALLQHAFGDFVHHEISEDTGYQDFLHATASMLASESPDTVLETGMLLRAIADRASGESAPVLQSEIVKLLVNADALTDEKFWLALPAIYPFRAAGSNWTITGGPAHEEVARHAIAVFADEQSSNQLIIQAAIVLRTLVDSGFELSDAQEQSLSKHIAVVLVQAAKEPRAAFLEVGVPIHQRRFVAPVLPLGKFADSEVGSASKLIVTLNLVQESGLHDLLSAELTRLFESFQQLPIHETGYLIDNIRDLGGFGWDRLVRSWKSKGLMESMLSRIVYLQSGFLIGKSEKELFARFDQKLPADLALEVDQALDVLEFSPSSAKQRSALFDLMKITSAVFPLRATRVIEECFTKNAAEFGANETRYFNRLADVWARATGDEFLISYARALQNADAQNRDALLKIELYDVDELTCSDPDNLKPLLAWCDQVLGSEDSKLDVDSWSVVRMLSGLLVDVENISTACQQRVVDRLESYSVLDNQNYWLRQTVGTENDPHNGLPSRLAVLRKAIEQLNDDSTSDETLDCQALAILSSGIGDIGGLTDDQRLALMDELRRRLAAAAGEPSAFAKLHKLSSGFSPIRPKCVGGYMSKLFVTDGSPASSNLVIMILNLLTDMADAFFSNLVANTKPEVAALHAATEELNLSTRRTMFNSSTWSEAIDSASSKQDLIHHVWFLQTGALLGKDAERLNERPAELYAAEQERKRRFVQPGDTLAIHVPHVLPLSGDPPVIQAGKSTPVTGFPVPVSAVGIIQLPMIDPLNVKGLELTQVHAVIEKAYLVDRNILRDDVPSGITVHFLLRDGQQAELRNIAGSSAVAPPRKE